MSVDVKAILGTMTFGNQVDQTTADKMLGLFLDSGHTEIDTAYLYTGGKSETILGKILKGIDRDSYSIATKAAPQVKGSLRPEAVEEQLVTSLKRLGLDYVDIFYLHMPDLTTPVELTLQACDKLHKEGKFKTLGLSNYAAWQVAQIACICEKNSFVSPQVYQGMYNVLTRQVEAELFPCIREYEISFYAYNPLSAGLLTGRYRRFEDLPEEGRFKVMDFYKDRYWKREYFEANSKLTEASGASGVSMTGAALIWLMQHSALNGADGDGIILGVSRLEHLKENLEYLDKPSLMAETARKYNEVWDIVKGCCPKYFRP
jgi:aflatoxin B1 aldehyde reductase